MNKIDHLLATRQYSMFHPTSKGDLLIDYPELKQVPSFMALIGNPKKMMFVWYYACKASDARLLTDDSDRIQFAIRSAWHDKAPKEVTDGYPQHKWGMPMQKAIDDMRVFEPGPRIRLKLMCAQAIGELQELLDKGAGSLTDWDERKNFVQTTKMSLELISDLLPRIEERALGIAERTNEQVAEAGAVMSWLRTRNMSQ